MAADNTGYKKKMSTVAAAGDDIQLAELRDRDLFTQPDSSHLGDCPICCLPLSLDQSKATFMGCCSKNMCRGCQYANAKRENEAGLEQRCAFCREPAPKSYEKHLKNVMNRIKKNDPDAMCYIGKIRHMKRDYENAFEYWTKAAGLSHPEAHFWLSRLYCEGRGVEKDMKKYAYHSEEAAIGGHPEARYNLGCEEVTKGRYERGKRHFIIAANLGYHKSLKFLMQLYAAKHANKEDYEGALRGYQAAVDATKSSEREKGEGFYKV